MRPSPRTIRQSSKRQVAILSFALSSQTNTRRSIGLRAKWQSSLFLSESGDFFAIYPKARELHARYLMRLSLIQQVVRRLPLACQGACIQQLSNQLPEGPALESC